MSEQECPICHDKIDDNINISISICSHKFHTNCLLLHGISCPVCGNNLITNTSKIVPGTYTYYEYKQLMQEHDISYDSLPYSTKDWLEQCEKYDNSMTELMEIQRKNEEDKKENLKKDNPNKYKLFRCQTKK